MRQPVIIGRGACERDVMVAYEYCSQRCDVLLFVASITLIKIGRIMYQHSLKYFYVREQGAGHFQNSG